jgi:hypothetical protein
MAIKQRVLSWFALCLPVLTLGCLLLLNPAALRADGVCACDDGKFSHGKCADCPPSVGGVQQCLDGSWTGCHEGCPDPAPCVYA